MYRFRNHIVRPAAPDDPASAVITARTTISHGGLLIILYAVTQTIVRPERMVAQMMAVLATLPRMMIRVSSTSAFFATLNTRYATADLQDAWSSVTIGMKAVKAKVNHYPFSAFPGYVGSDEPTYRCPRGRNRAIAARASPSEGSNSTARS